MAPKDKATELVEKFKEATFKMDHYAIQCAIIAVEEIIKTLESTQYLKEKSNILELRLYWQSVLTELKSM